MFFHFFFLCRCEIAVYVRTHVATDLAARLYHQFKTFRIQEPFKKQMVFERIHIGATDTIQNQRTSSGASSKSRNRFQIIFVPVENFFQYKEVIRKSRSDNILHLIVETIKIRLPFLIITSFQKSFPSLFPELLRAVFKFRQLDIGVNFQLLELGKKLIKIFHDLEIDFFSKEF